MNENDGSHENLSDYDAGKIDAALLNLDPSLFDDVDTSASADVGEKPEVVKTVNHAGEVVDVDAAPVRSTEPVPSRDVTVPPPAPVKRARKLGPGPRVGRGVKAHAAFAGRFLGFHALRLPRYFGVGVKVAAARQWKYFKKGKGWKQKLAHLAPTLIPAAIVWLWSENGRWGAGPLMVVIGVVIAFIVSGIRNRRVVAPGQVVEQDGAPVTDGAVAAAEPRPVVVTAAPPEGEPVQQKLSLFGGKAKGPALSTDEDQELPPLVLRALTMAGFGALHGAKSRIVEGSAQRVQGGVEMVVKMAPGLETARLIKEHGQFASAMGMPAERVVVEPLPSVSPGAFELFIADELLSQMPSPPWPWADVRRRSFFDEVPIGVDSRGRSITVPFFETNGTVSGDVGMGKSATARMLVLGALMDPRTKVIIHNFKGGMDYKAFGSVAHKLRNGCDADDLNAFLETLAWLKSEVARRNKVLEGLSFEECPDSKLTDALANREDLRPVFVLLDELPRVFLSEISTKAEEGILDIVQTARSVGINVRLVFQGAKEGTVPARILDRCKHRIGHGVNSVPDANQALGEGAHGRGYRAVEIDTPGVAYAGVAGGHMDKVKLSYLDMPTVHAMVQEIEVMRREAGMLSGTAAGEIPADDDDGTAGRFLDVVTVVWPVDEGAPRSAASLGELASLMNAHDPDEWDLDTRKIGAMFREAGVTPGTVRVGGDTPKGVKRSDVVQVRGRLRGR